MATADEAVTSPVIAHTYQAFKLEHHGIGLIPESDRRSSPLALFWMWAGAIFNVEFVVYGALIVFFGLSLGQAILAILVGNLFYVLLGLASLQGQQTGTTTFVISRAAFGQNGNRLVCLFNWLTQLGFETEGIYLIVGSLIILLAKAGLSQTGSTSEKIILVVLAVVAQIVMPFFGHATITRMLRSLSLLFIPLFLIMAVLLVGKVHPGRLHQHASAALWTTALVLVVSAGGLGWTENGNDYSRYLPTATSYRKTFWAATLGGTIPSILLEILGACAFTAVPRSQQETITAVTGLPAAFPSWFLYPLLIVGIFQLLSINTLDLYSSSVTLQALGAPVKRWSSVVIDTVICAIATAVVLFKGNFYTDLSGFLDYIVVWLGPWFGIFFVDWLLRGRRYDAESLVRPGRGAYWQNGGIHWPAIAAQLVGMFAALMWINARYDVPSYTGWLCDHVPGFEGADMSAYLGLLVGGGVYYLLARRSVPAQAARHPREAATRPRRA